MAFQGRLREFRDTHATVNDTFSFSTAMIDFDNPTTYKRISKIYFTMTEGATHGNFSVRAFYKVSADDTFMFLGEKFYNDFLDGYDTNISKRLMLNVSIPKFKKIQLKFKIGAVSDSDVGINDINVEYRLLRDVSVSTFGETD